MKQLTFNKTQGEKVTCPRTRGFTLVETVIYIAFVAILSVLATEATMIMMRSFYTLRLTNNINQSATVALERMSREIRNSYDIDATESTLGANPGRLTLKTKDSVGSNTTIEFYISGGQIRIKEGGGDKGSLMTKNATVTNLVFRQIATINSKAIKIELTLRDVYGAIQKDSNFYNTIVLRGSAH